MKKFLTIFAVLLAFLVTNTFAKSKSRSSSWGGSKSKSSYSKPSKSKSSYTSYKPAKKSTSSWSSQKKVTKPSNSYNSKSTVHTTTKPKAVSINKLDVKQTKKQTSSKNAKRYTSKKEAETAARKDLVSKNSYTSPKPPTVRPSHVPHTVTRNGRSYDTDYYRFPNGSYGYGYRDPTTGLIVGLLAADMMMDAAYMRNHGYSYGPAPRSTHTTHVVHHSKSESRPISTMGWIFIFFITFTIIGLIIYAICKSS